MKPQPRLQHMPYLIKRRIVKHLEYYAKMSLRTTCPEFHSTIRDPHLHCDSFQLTEESDGILMEFRKDSDVFKKTYRPEKAVKVFRMLIDNPNFSISRFNICLSEGPTCLLFKIESILANLRVKLKVKRFSMRYEDSEAVIRILPHLDSEYLDAANLTSRIARKSLCCKNVEKKSLRQLRWKHSLQNRNQNLPRRR